LGLLARQGVLEEVEQVREKVVVMLVKWRETVARPALVVEMAVA
jgi:hypothetical protein